MSSLIACTLSGILCGFTIKNFWYGLSASVLGALLLSCILGCSTTDYAKAVSQMTDAEICAQVRDRGQHGQLSATEARDLAVEMDKRGIVGKECL